MVQEIIRILVIISHKMRKDANNSQVIHNIWLKDNEIVLKIYIPPTLPGNFDGLALSQNTKSSWVQGLYLRKLTFQSRI